MVIDNSSICNVDLLSTVDDDDWAWGITLGRVIGGRIGPYEMNE